MRLLLDAHTFLWFVWDDEQLTRHAQGLIQHAGNQKYLSAATYMVERLPIISGDHAFDAYPITRLW